MKDTSTEFKDQGTRSGVWIRVRDLGWLKSRYKIEVQSTFA